MNEIKQAIFKDYFRLGYQEAVKDLGYRIDTSKHSENAWLRIKQAYVEIFKESEKKNTLTDKES